MLNKGLDSQTMKSRSYTKHCTSLTLTAGAQTIRMSSRSVETKNPLIYPVTKDIDKGGLETPTLIDSSTSWHLDWLGDNLTVYFIAEFDCHKLGEQMNDAVLLEITERADSDGDGKQYLLNCWVLFKCLAYCLTLLTSHAASFTFK